MSTSDRHASEKGEKIEIGRIVPAGTHVEVVREILAAGQRAPGVPEDTAHTPYRVRTRGILVEETPMFGQATVLTPAGRLYTGRIILESPPDNHSFGRRHPALLEAITSIHGVLRGER